MTRALAFLASIALLGACDTRNATAADPPRAQPVAATRTTEVRASRIPKTADPHFRELLAAIADARACKQVKDTFHALRSSDDPNTVTGALWIRQCKIDSDGTHLSFHFAGDGWQRVDRKTKKLGATFTVHEYVRFHVTATLDGTLDIAYAPRQHVATIWFEPTKAPDVKFEPVGNVKVDWQGAWSQIIGGIATVIGKAPSKEAKKQVEQQGQQGFSSKLDDGMTITYNACTGSTRSQFGLLPPGKEAPLDVGDTMHVGVELYKGGIQLFGPEYATRTLEIDASATKGPVHVAIACMKEANQIANAFVAGQPLPQVKSVYEVDVTGHRDLRIARPSCPFAVIATSDAGTVQLRWKKEPPPNTGLIDCPAKQENPETATHAHATPQNTPSLPGPHNSRQPKPPKK